MTSAAKKILDEALALSQDERAELVVSLKSSLESAELTPEWDAEIAHRSLRLANSEANFEDAEEQLRTLRAKYNR